MRVPRRIRPALFPRIRPDADTAVSGVVLEARFQLPAQDVLLYSAWAGAPTPTEFAELTALRAPAQLPAWARFFTAVGAWRLMWPRALLCADGEPPVLSQRRSKPTAPSMFSA
jgi:hypothetical protein